MKKVNYYLKIQILFFCVLISVNLHSCKFRSKTQSSVPKKNKVSTVLNKLKTEKQEIKKIKNEEIPKIETDQNKTPENNTIVKLNTAGNEDTDALMGEEGEESEDEEESEKEETEEYDDDGDKEIEEEGGELYTTTSSARLGFADEPSKIALTPNSEEETLPTISLTYEGPSQLPSEYAKNKEFEEDLKSLRKSARRQMRKNFKQLKGELYDCSNGGKNLGMSPIRFKVRLCKLKRPKWGYGHIFDPRKLAKQRKRATRATIAHTRSTGECKDYKSLVLLNILRQRSEDEDKFRRFMRKLITLGKANGNDPKVTSLCVNDGIQPLSPLRRKLIKREEDENIQTKVTADNTELELIKVFIVRKSIGRADSFPIENGMQEIDENTLLCYNTQIKDTKRKIIKKRNEKVYFKVITKYDWIGPLNSIPEDDYVLEGKRKSSWKKTARNKVTKKISRKFMVFANKDVYKITNKAYKGIIPSDLENDPKPVAEFVIIWRLKIGGITVGVIPAAESWIVVGTEDWGKEGGLKGKLKYVTGKVFRFFHRLFARMEISSDAYE
ncbi:MAG: hypothetical protein GY830_02790 [Bacteroidetes bacterium]|nr:hypothetical protein [Bacteroidota bacterium]